MRVFLTLFSLATVSWAKPQYNYGSGVSGTFGSGGSRASGQIDTNFGLSGSNFQAGGAGQSFGGSSFGSGSSYGGSALSGGSSFGSGSVGGGASSFGGSSFQPSGSNYHHNQQQSSHQGFESPLVHKQFITVTAPEDNDNLESTKHLVIGRPQKNYRVVFIKSPSSSSANVRLSAEYAPKEEKTVIYVLSKKDSQLEINDIATPEPTIPSKPEVFFIKYKTEAEAQHAQRQIQAEYDKIEGTSEHSDAGVAQQQSVVGILGNGHGAGGNLGSSAGSFNAGAGGGSSNSFASGGSSSSFNGGSSPSFNGGSSSFGSSQTAAKAAAYLPPTSV